MQKIFLISCLLLSIIAFNAPASAQSEMHQNRLAFSIGGFNLLDGNDVAVDLRAELRFAYKVVNLFHPFIGLETTSDGALYTLAGLLWDYQFCDRWFVTPSLGVGLYKDGDGLDMGHTIQFRTQFEGGYEFDNGHRLSLSYSHVSNGGLGDSNPGAEVIGLYYSLPIDWFK